jgi:hypothetical protein
MTLTVWYLGVFSLLWGPHTIEHLIYDRLAGRLTGGLTRAHDRHFESRSVVTTHPTWGSSGALLCVTVVSGRARWKLHLILRGCHAFEERWPDRGDWLILIDWLTLECKGCGPYTELLIDLYRAGPYTYGGPSKAHWERRCRRLWAERLLEKLFALTPTAWWPP